MPREFKEKFAICKHEKWIAASQLSPFTVLKFPPIIRKPTTLSRTETSLLELEGPCAPCIICFEWTSKFEKISSLGSAGHLSEFCSTDCQVPLKFPVDPGNRRRADVPVCTKANTLGGKEGKSKCHGHNEWISMVIGSKYRILASVQKSYNQSAVLLVFCGFCCRAKRGLGGV